jgi:membrane peptidoglycan carboxypeptidase
VVLVDVETGEVLALAGAGGGIETGRRVRRLRAVEDLFEPGSVYKLVTFVAAIENGLLDDDDLFYAERGRCDFGGYTIRDVKKMEWLCPADILSLSSNIATAKIGEKVGARELYAHSRRMGFGVRTLVELPGEQRGLLRPVSSWSGRSAATVAIGQEVSVTALQLAMAYAAVANGGELMKPRLVREVRRPDGSVRVTCEPEVVRRAMGTETAARLRGYLHRAVVNGTGTKADPGVFPVAGKTGTAQKARGGGKGYAEGAYVACFAGFFPVERPAVAAVVVIDEPRGKRYYGGDVAAPVFAEIARGAATLAAASGGQRELPDIVQAMEETVRVPDLRGLATAAAVERLDRCGLRATVVHQNAQVLVQEPRPGATVRPGTAVALYGEAGLAEHVPDVTGLTLREAMRELRPTGLEIKALGSGVIVEQTPLAGSPLPAQGTCRLVLASR